MKLIWLLVLGAFVLGVYIRARPRVVVRIQGGTVGLVRGQLPGRVLDELSDVARLSPEAKGRVELHGHGEFLSVRTRGLPEGIAQRFRNTLRLRQREF